MSLVKMTKAIFKAISIPYKKGKELLMQHLQQREICQREL